MTIVKDKIQMTELANDSLAIEKRGHEQLETLPLTYFELIDETPEFSEAAILLEDNTIEYCYVKLGHDGSQYFGFNYTLPSSSEYQEILCRHKLVKKMEANTFEKYPSGKTVLSRGGKIIEINLPKQEKSNV